MFHPVLQCRASFLQVAVGCDGDDEEGPAACVAEDGRGRRWVARTAGAGAAAVLAERLKGSIGQGSNHSNFSDQSSVQILS